MTTSTPLDNVIEHATETTKAANERVREFAQIGVRKAAEGFEQISKAAQTASAELNTQFVQARDGATKASLKLLEVAKEDADAGFAGILVDGPRDLARPRTGRLSRGAWAFSSASSSTPPPSGSPHSSFPASSSPASPHCCWRPWSSGSSTPSSARSW